MATAYAVEEDETKIALHTQPSSSPFMFVPQANPDNPDAVDIMGFVSVQTEDRDGEIFAPETFNKSQFLSVAGPVFINHKAWLDERGNPVSAGKVKSLHVVRVRNSKTEKGLLEIVDTERRRVIATYPKDHAPDIRPGTKGLFTKITVTEPAVVKQVRMGQLKAFSWRGQAVRDTQFDMQRRRTVKTASHIDLWEISLVNIPANPDASFMVEKGRLIGVVYDDGTTENGLDFFRQRTGIAESAIIRDENSGKLVVRLREKSPKPESVVVVKSVFGEDLVLDCSKLPTGACEMADVHEEQTVEEIISQAVEKSAEATKGLADDVADLKTVTAATNETLAAMAKSVTELAARIAEGFTALQKGPATQTPDEEVEEEAEDTAKSTGLSSDTKEVLKGLTELTASLKSLVPRKDEREEDVQKGVKDKDPLAVFDSLFTI
jgi:hypothetical protein